MGGAVQSVIKHCFMCRK